MPATNKTWHIQHRAQLHQTTDKSKKYLCPPETDTHLATLLSFPSRRSTLPNLHAKTTNEIISLAATIAAFEPVRLHARSEDLTDAQALLDKHTLPPQHRANISLIAAPTNHCWIRDTGPVYVRSADRADKTRYAIDFGFCEWGHKTDEYIYGNSSQPDRPVMDEAALRENTAFASTVLDLENEGADEVIMRVQTDLRLEGGGIEIDGEGTFMATESSILGARNPGVEKAAIEEELRRLLGVRKFIWFPGRVGLDITDVHVDAEARFVRPGVVVVCRPHETAGEVHWEIYREIRAVLESSTDACGRRFEVHDVVEADIALIKGDIPGEEAAPAASYVNFYFVNGGLVIPAFGDAEADAKAFELLKSLVPGKEVRQVEVNALPRTGGVLHCVTQQVM
ncbi:Peptidyl-arginine deiminase Porphyromonas-type [Penicillium paradoxum]|uniref:Peptidyl-arginine deiminase Porphyromonas-type n=1 Tax=Penicillium paradoxum TaxID=176176 RepID=UPI00254697E9|nr:Peptidyl-arginine deiminase Porphyromonas-type [Penicillium paradoxum]KAJ5787539.1 Peptidyl-arginine deiminase Porphyromonas-type [Penicillium paradoxum]